MIDQMGQSFLSEKACASIDAGKTVFSHVNIPTVKPYNYIVSFPTAGDITCMKCKIDGSKNNIRKGIYKKVKVIVLAVFY